MALAAAGALAADAPVEPRRTASWCAGGAAAAALGALWWVGPLLLLGRVQPAVPRLHRDARRTRPRRPRWSRRCAARPLGRVRRRQPAHRGGPPGWARRPTRCWCSTRSWSPGSGWSGWPARGCRNAASCARCAVRPARWSPSGTSARWTRPLAGRCASCSTVRSRRCGTCTSSTRAAAAAGARVAHVLHLIARGAARARRWRPGWP